MGRPLHGTSCPLQSLNLGQEKKNLFYRPDRLPYPHLLDFFPHHFSGKNLTEKCEQKNSWFSSIFGAIVLKIFSKNSPERPLFEICAPIEKGFVFSPWRGNQDLAFHAENLASLCFSRFFRIQFYHEKLSNACSIHQHLTKFSYLSSQKASLFGCISMQTSKELNLFLIITF